MNSYLQAALAMLALCQFFFLPGICAFAISGKTVTIGKLPIIFMFSTFCNFVLVLFLFIIGQSSGLIAVPVCALELILIFRYYNRLTFSFSSYEFAVCVIAFILIVPYISDGLLNVFVKGDVIQNYNRWALDWYHGNYPEITWNYPQFIPANWALMYVISGYPLEILARTFMPFFAFFYLLQTLNAPIDRIKAGFFLIFGGFILVRLFGPHIDNGMVDVPVLFISWTTLTIAYRASAEKSISEQASIFILTAIAAVAAGHTKQTGVMAGIFSQLYLWRTFSPSIKSLRERLLVFLPIISVALLTAPYYLHGFYRIKMGTDFNVTQVNTVTGHMGRNFLERLVHSISMLEGRFTGTVLVIFVILMLISLKGGRLAWYNLGFGFSWLFIWAPFLSYDLKNTSAAIPPLTYAIAVGAEILVKRLFKRSIKDGSEVDTVLPAYFSWILVGVAGIIVLLGLDFRMLKFLILLTFLVLTIYVAYRLLSLNVFPRWHSLRAVFPHAVGILCFLTGVLVFGKIDLRARQIEQLKQRGGKEVVQLLKEVTPDITCRKCIITTSVSIQENSLYREYFLPYHKTLGFGERPFDSITNLKKWIQLNEGKYILAFYSLDKTRDQVDFLLKCLDVSIIRNDEQLLFVKVNQHK